MNSDIETTLNTHRPTLSDAERGKLWAETLPHLTPRERVSPFMWMVSHRRASAALALLLFISLGGATTVLAEQSLPGDRLFALDRAMERLSLKLARDDDRRHALGAEHAEERLGELRLIIGERRNDDTEHASTSSHERVGAAVDALVRVLDESNMSETARENIYEHLFTEIDPLTLDVRIDEEEDDDRTSKKRVEIKNDDEGKTRIQVDREGGRVQIERTDGKVHIRYESENGEVKGDSIDRRGRGKKGTGGED